MTLFNFSPSLPRFFPFLFFSPSLRRDLPVYIYHRCGLDRGPTPAGWYTSTGPAGRSVFPVLPSGLRSVCVSLVSVGRSVDSGPCVCVFVTHRVASRKNRAVVCVSGMVVIFVDRSRDLSGPRLVAYASRAVVDLVRTIHDNSRHYRDPTQSA